MVRFRARRGVQHVLAVTGAIAVAIAVVLAVLGTATTAEAKGKPHPLVITSITPTPGATDVPTTSDGVITIQFSQPLADFPDVSVIDETTGQDVSQGGSLFAPGDTITIFGTVCTPDGTSCSAGVEPGTTYLVTLGGKGSARVVSDSKAVLSGSEVPDVTVSKGVATFSFTIAPAPLT